MHLEKLIEKYSELKTNITSTEQQFTPGLCSYLGKNMPEKRALSWDFHTTHQDFLCPIRICLFGFFWGFVFFFFLFLKEHRNILQVSYQAMLNAKWAFNIQLSMKKLDTPRTSYSYDMLQSP